MRGDLAFDEAAGDGGAVDGAGGLEAGGVGGVLRVGRFGGFEGAGGEGCGGGMDG